MFPIIGKLKGYLFAAAAFLVTLAGMLFAARKSGKDAVRAQNARKSVEVQSKATSAIIEGSKREAKIRNTAVDTTKRDHFNR